jgi:hypothetical protein
MMQVLLGFNSGGMPKRFLASNTHSSRSLKSSAKKNAIAGTDCGLDGRAHRKSPGSSAPPPCATAIASKKLWS